MLRKIVKVSIVLIIIASLGVIAYSSDSDKAISYSQEEVTQIDNEAANIAEKFINEYLISNDFDKWLKNAPVTSRFRNEIKERSRVLNISELLLGQIIKMENLSLKDKQLLKKKI